MAGPGGGGDRSQASGDRRRRRRMTNSTAAAIKPIVLPTSTKTRAGSPRAADRFWQGRALFAVASAGVIPVGGETGSTSTSTRPRRRKARGVPQSWVGVRTGTRDRLRPATATRTPRSASSAGTRSRPVGAGRSSGAGGSAARWVWSDTGRSVRRIRSVLVSSGAERGSPRDRTHPGPVRSTVRWRERVTLAPNRFRRGRSRRYHSVGRSGALLKAKPTLRGRNLAQGAEEFPPCGRGRPPDLAGPRASS